MKEEQKNIEEEEKKASTLSSEFINKQGIKLVFGKVFVLNIESTHNKKKKRKGIAVYAQNDVVYHIHTCVLYLLTIV